METNRRVRPQADVGNDVGMQRYNRYRSVIGQYKKSMEQGFYLEAITLMESIIADRLESKANYISVENYSYSTLERLCRFLTKKEHQNKLSEDFLKTVHAIEEWKDGRNRALHEMAKLEGEHSQSFEILYSSSKKTAEKGYHLFSEINNCIKQDKRLSASTKKK